MFLALRLFKHRFKRRLFDLSSRLATLCVIKTSYVVLNKTKINNLIHDCILLSLQFVI